MNDLALQQLGQAGVVLYSVHYVLFVLLEAAGGLSALLISLLSVRLSDPLDVVPARFASQVLDLVLIVLVIRLEQIGRLHGSALLRAQEALDHAASAEAEDRAVVADPIEVWDALEAVALLVHRHRAPAAKHNLVVIFIVANPADRAALIVLSHVGSMLVVQADDALLQLLPLGLVVLSLLDQGVDLFHLVQYLFVANVIPPLLAQLQFLEEVVLELARVVDVKNELVEILSVPLSICEHVLREPRIYVGHEVLAILAHFLWFIEDRILEIHCVLGLIYGICVYFLHFREEVIEGVFVLLLHVVVLLFGLEEQLLKVLVVDLLLDLSNLLIGISPDFFDFHIGNFIILPWYLLGQRLDLEHLFVVEVAFLRSLLQVLKVIFEPRDLFSLAKQFVDMKQLK